MNRKTEIYLKNEYYDIVSDIPANIEIGGVDYIDTVDVIESFNELINIKGSLYTVNRASFDGHGGYSMMIVTKVELENEDDCEDTIEENVTCPVCGYVESDSWELPEDDDEYECGNCHAVLSYCRNVTVEYHTELKEYPKA